MSLALRPGRLLLRDTVDARRIELAGPQRVGYAILAAGAVSTLPAWARATLLLPTLPAADRLVTRPLTRTALGTIRWALAGAPDQLPSALLETGHRRQEF